MNDLEIIRHLRWLYEERTLCTWCRHPSSNHRPTRRGLCAICYRLALDFRRTPTAALAVAIAFAQSEGVTDLATRPIDALSVENLFERIAAASFRWRVETDNPFWHSANTWGESYSDAQLRLLFHYFSLVDRELNRKARRGRAWSYAQELLVNGQFDELRRYTSMAEAAVRLAWDEN